MSETKPQAMKVGDAVEEPETGRIGVVTMPGNIICQVKFSDGTKLARFVAKLRKLTR